jgi:hypothetical protein
MERAADGGPFDGFGAGIAPRKTLRLLDFLEHLEDTFRRADEKALVGLAKAATLEGISAGSGSFCHGITSSYCGSRFPESASSKCSL